MIRAHTCKLSYTHSYSPYKRICQGLHYFEQSIVHSLQFTDLVGWGLWREKKTAYANNNNSCFYTTHLSKPSWRIKYNGVIFEWEFKLLTWSENKNVFGRFETEIRVFQSSKKNHLFEIEIV